MSDNTIRVAELFAGVGGFRLGLEGYDPADHDTPDDAATAFAKDPAGPFVTVWANQWEPPGSPAKQFAWRCYEARFGAGSCVNRDIHEVLDEAEAGTLTLPDVDLLVGGFPCQDYSVAKPLSHAGGIEGKKGVLWWDIHRFLTLKRPARVLLENVDRLLKSPASQRGRDFAIMLSCLAGLGYEAEWRVVNSADYGAPQRRKRVYIYAHLAPTATPNPRDDQREGGSPTGFPDDSADPSASAATDPSARCAHLLADGVIARALPCAPAGSVREFDLPRDPYDATEHFGLGAAKSPFDVAGAMSGYHVATGPVDAVFEGRKRTLGDVLVDEARVPDAFYLAPDTVEKWRYLKGSKREERTDRKTGFTYHYSEGAMAFPDTLDKPSRTILTGEGGSGASRFKHVVEVDGRLRRLVPDELDALQGFPPGWTDAGMTDAQRAFCMGNALVVDVVHAIGRAIADDVAAEGPAR